MQTTNTLHVNISGLTCGACFKLVNKRLSSIDGVREVTVKNMAGETEILAERQISVLELQDALSGTDYKIS